ncbi:uncharacterized protein LOC143019019 isoform X2 [Oratosquilla oratoria]|uniref:uncharacterized protein LOC143019019 isoform X2 n=1 Tax=Oratosquilla oratoria TaxID=337810 RepID=UPI003F75F55E
MNVNRGERKPVARGNDGLRMDGITQYMDQIGEAAGKGTRILEELQQKRNKLRKVLEVAVGDTKMLRELQHRYKAELVQLEQRERDILARTEKEMKIISTNKQKLEALHETAATVENEFQEKVSQFEKWSKRFLDQFMNMKLKSEQTEEVEVTDHEVTNLASQLKDLEVENEVLLKSAEDEAEDLVDSLEHFQKTLDSRLKALRQKSQEEHNKLDELERNINKYEDSNAPDKCAGPGAAP